MAFDGWILRLLSMSLSGSVVILILLLIRRGLKRAPKVFSFALWSSVFFRLLLPISIPSDISIFSLLNGPMAEVADLQEHFRTTQLPMKTNLYVTTHGFSKTQGQDRTSLDVHGKDEAFAVLTGVWCIGMAGLFLRNMAQWLRLRRILAGARVLQGNVHLVDNLQTPIIVGLIRPKIYLPSEMSEHERSYVMAHEKYHIHRGDPIYKCIAFVALCVHWFNPLVWMAITLFESDMEMSCDEAVLGKLNLSIRADYARSLLRFTIKGGDISGTSLAFSTGNTKERIENIMTFRKTSTVAMLGMTIAVCILSGCLFTNPKTESHDVSRDEGYLSSREASPATAEEVSYPASTTMHLMPIDITFTKKDIPHLLDSLNRSDVLAVYVDWGLSLRIRRDGTAEKSEDGGSSWGRVAYDVMDAKEYAQWVMKNDPLPGYSMQEFQARLKHGAEVRHMVLAQGKEMYLILDAQGAQLELVQEEKIESMLMDGQRMMMTSTRCCPFRFSGALLGSFEECLRTCGIISGAKDQAEWDAILETLQENGEDIY